MISFFVFKYRSRAILHLFNNDKKYSATLVQVLALVEKLNFLHVHSAGLLIY